MTLNQDLLLEDVRSPSRSKAAGLLDLPKEIVAAVVGVLPYVALPAFRATCKLAKELVDGSSNGWVMKVEEGEALQTSSLLQRLTSLCYMWFESWTWEGDQEANFLAVILTNMSVFKRLQEVRFPGTSVIPLRCLRGMLAALASVDHLSLPPLPPAVVVDSPQHRAALASIAGLTTLMDLNIEGWALTDAAARTLSAGLPRIRRLVLGNVSAMSVEGYRLLARLTGLHSLTATHARGSNSTLEPLTALTALSGLRLELASGFGDDDPGPLACLPSLRTYGWWHADVQRPAGLRAGCVAPWLRELSLCFDLDVRALSILAGCSGLTLMQVHSITLPTPADEALARKAPGGPSSMVAPGSSALPVICSLRTLILGELSMPPPSEPQPTVLLSELFPSLQNVLAFGVVGRGLQHLSKASRLKRLVLNCLQLRDEVLEQMPSLPSLVGLQLESCAHLTESAVGVLRSTPGLEQLMLFSTPAVTDAFLAGAAALMRAVRSIVLYNLPNVHDEGLQALEAVAGSLENLELRSMPSVTPAGLQVVHQLPRVVFVAVSECSGLSKAACRQLATELEAGGRDVLVEHETTILLSSSLADEFGEGGEAQAEAERGSRAG